jgi:hypothetical protein
MASKKSTKKLTVSAPVHVSDSDSESEVESSNDEKLVAKSKTTVTKKGKTMNVEAIDDDSEEVNNVSESETESESDSESENNQDKKKEKKLKESFDELTKRLDVLQISIKNIDKEILEADKMLKVKEKSRNDFERQRNSILKLLSKTHNDEVTKARKEKPKRKGNINGGFCKDHPVPEILIKFLGLEPGAMMKRPQVMSALSNKLTELKLKQGQNTILDKATVKALELDKSYDGKVIKFGEFQTFLKGFFPTKEVQNTVVV